MRVPMTPHASRWGSDFMHCQQTRTLSTGRLDTAELPQAGSGPNSELPARFSVASCGKLLLSPQADGMVPCRPL